MSSKPLPSSPSHGVTNKFTYIYQYKQYWTEETAELVTKRNQTRKRVERDPTNDTRAHYNKVEAHVKAASC